MSTTYPTSKKTFTDHVDNDAGDFIDAADINDVHDTVEAMETVLGGDFQGAIKNINIDAAAAIAISKTALGTFTDWTTYVPVVTGSTTAGAGTYIVQKGEYCQLGKIVYFTAEVNYTAHTGTGALQVSIPVASGSYDANLYFICAATTTYANLPVNSLWVQGRIGTGLSYARFIISYDDANTSNLQVINETTAIDVSGFYKVA